jgi:hypothetical protein
MLGENTNEIWKMVCECMRKYSVKFKENPSKVLDTGFIIDLCSSVCNY